MKECKEIWVIDEVELEEQNAIIDYMSLLISMKQRDPKLTLIVTGSPEKSRQIQRAIYNAAYTQAKCKVSCIRDGKKLYVLIREEE